MKPQRIQLSRKKGWRMPPDTVKVDRTTRFGNPFIVGTDGIAVECVYQVILLNAGYHCISASRACVDRQDKYFKTLQAEMKAGYPALRGKNLACWCRIGQPCHGDVLLLIVNRTRRTKFDMDGFLAGYGWRFENGKPIRLEIEK